MSSTITPAHRPLSWTPPGIEETPLVLAGVHWDAVRAPQQLADDALAEMASAGYASGPVVEDTDLGWLYWLIPVGAADEWPRIPQVTIFRETERGAYVGVPPEYREKDGLRWRVPFVGGHYLTDPGALLHALRAAAS